MNVIRIKQEQLDAVRAYLPPELFGLAARGEAAVLGAAEGGTVCAVLAVCEQNGTGRLLYAATAEAQRGRGLCTLLVESYIWAAAEAGLREIACLLDGTEACTPVERVLIALGFDFQPEEACLRRSTLGAFLSAPLPRNEADSGGVLPLGELGEASRRELCAALPFDYVPAELAVFDPALSCAAFSGGRPAGAALVRYGGGTLRLDCLYAAPDAPNAARQLLSACARAAETRGLPPETPLTVAVVSPAAEKLVSRLLPEAETTRCARMALALRPEKEAE